MGLLEEAQDTYECAQEDALRAGDRELEARALLGLAVVAGHRGNYPEVLTHGRRALELLPAGSEYAANAHNDLMIAAMVTRDFPAAFEHGWKGYDAAGADAESKASMIINLSSLAMRTGRPTAARRGFLAAFAMTRIHHRQLPALGGLALASATLGDAAELRRIADKIEEIATSSPLAYEISAARFELAQAWKETGNLEEADKCLACARDLAVAHGFHEVTFRSDLLAEALAAARAEANTPIRNDRVEHAIARLEELTVDEHALSVA
jgi:tetratricopeptide (TPR) repeat protein